jgi:RecB family exonuclease
MHKQISSYNNYENEFEIYIKHLDFYLFGIIDKIIFDKTTAFIIDYKTDSLKKYSAIEKLDSYKYQLMFYAYLVSRMNTDIDSFICQLVFIENPEEKVLIEVKSDDLQDFEKNMILGINAMRNQTYNKNISHCKSCYFSDENYKCII